MPFCRNAKNAKFDGPLTEKFQFNLLKILAYLLAKIAFAEKYLCVVFYSKKRRKKLRQGALLTVRRKKVFIFIIA
jgi:hypothetical protein